MQRLLASAISLGVLLTGQQAAAQTTTSFRGLRAEVQAGIDRFYSEGVNDHSFGYGGMVGFDGMLGDRLVIGAEGTYWKPDGRNVTPEAVRTTSEEWSAALRAGVLVTPSLLVYGKGGYAVNEQTKTLPRRSTVERYRSTGYQVGGGIEQSFNENLYLKGEVRYSNYVSHSSRLVGLVGLGVRFR